MRNLWDWIMIGLMLAVICFCLLDVWSSPAPLRCVVGIGGAIVVIERRGPARFFEVS